MRMCGRCAYACLQLPTEARREYWIPLEPVLQVAVNTLMLDAQKRLQVFCKSSSQPHSYLSNPLVGFPMITSPFHSNDVYFKFKMLILIIGITLIPFSILSCECKDF